MQVILMPIDFSDTTDRVVDWVAQVASPLDAEVYVLHVSESELNDPKQGKVALLPKVEAVVECLEAKGCKAQPLLVFGPAAASILDQIEVRQPTMVVMGSHGHGALYDLVIGSVTGTILRTGKCPVVVVPSPRPACEPTADDIAAGAMDDFYGFPGMW